MKLKASIKSLGCTVSAGGILPLPANTGLSGGTGISIDLSDNVWLGSYGANIYELSNAGSKIAQYVVSPTGVAAAIAIDGSNNVWAAGISGVVKLSNSGTILSGRYGFTGSNNLYLPYGLAMDHTGDAWIATGAVSVPGSVVEVSTTGVFLSGSNNFATSGPSYASAIAIDNSGNAWLTGSTGGVYELASTGSYLSPTTGYPSGGTSPAALSIDGGGNVWVANMKNIAKLSSSGTLLSGTGGYTGNLAQYTTALSSPTSIAADASGNLWIGNSSGTAAAMVEFVGASVPVVTPLALGAKNNTLGARP